MQRGDSAGRDAELDAAAKTWPHPFADVHGDAGTITTKVIAEIGDGVRGVAKKLVEARRVTALLGDAGVLALRSFEVEGSTGRIILRTAGFAGLTVGELVERGDVPAARVIAVLRGVVRALSAAHAEGLLHRALSPASVLVDANDAVRVLDFGIGELLKVDSPSRSSRLQPFTPERVLGLPPSVAEDVYLVGCLAYFLVTGAPPFIDDDVEHLRRKHAIEDPPRLASRAGDRLPLALARALDRCLAKDAEDRPASLDELAKVLADAASEIAATGEVARPRPTTGPQPSVARPITGPQAMTRATTGPQATTGAKPTTGPQATTGARPTTGPQATTGAKPTTGPRPVVAPPPPTSSKPITGPQATTSARPITGSHATTAAPSKPTIAAPPKPIAAPPKPIAAPPKPIAAPPKPITGPHATQPATIVTPSVAVPVPVATSGKSEELSIELDTASAEIAAPKPPVVAPVATPTAMAPSEPEPTTPRADSVPAVLGASPPPEVAAPPPVSPSTTSTPVSAPAAMRGRKPLPWRPLAAAAAILLFIGVAAAMSSDDDAPKITTNDPPRGPSEAHVAAPSDGATTRGGAAPTPPTEPTDVAPTRDAEPTPPAVIAAAPSDASPPAADPLAQALDEPTTPDAEAAADVEVASDAPAAPEVSELLASAKVARQQGRRADAVTAYKKVATIDPDNAEALGALARISFDRADFGDAVTWGKRAVAASPKSGKARIALGDAYYKLGKRSEAQKQYQKADALGHKLASRRLAMLAR
ncbi:MAG TPA: tetratricopeptide repeat protein [Nannocystaceae bacterium]|nr:tetratricopeptide repeat protein [Nannocystaceae bacterium]